MIKPNMYSASLHIKNTFYTIPIYESHTKFLKFTILLTALYQFTPMSNGYIDPIRVFTKLLKPPLCCLREQGYCIPL